jgi:RNA polymerase sigma-70 factor (ECF subfamily)
MTTAEAGSNQDAGATQPQEAALSLEGFVALHYQRLVRLAGIVCLDRTDAQDAVQNALERAWRHRSSLQDGDRIKPWLDSIVVRESIRLNGRGRSVLRRMTRRLAGSEDSELVYHQPMPSGLLDELRRLPLAQRAVLALHYEAGYQVAEVAELVGAPLETVRSRLRLARERLRRAQADDVEVAS